MEGRNRDYRRPCPIRCYDIVHPPFSRTADDNQDVRNLHVDMSCGERRAKIDSLRERRSVAVSPTPLTMQPLAELYAVLNTLIRSSPSPIRVLRLLIHVQSPPPHKRHSVLSIEFHRLANSKIQIPSITLILDLAQPSLSVSDQAREIAVPHLMDQDRSVIISLFVQEEATGVSDVILIVTSTINILEKVEIL